MTDFAFYYESMIRSFLLTSGRFANALKYPAEVVVLLLLLKSSRTLLKSSVGISSVAEEIQIRHLVCQIDLIREQLAEIDKKIEEFSVQTNSPILSIPGISHFSRTSILSELGDIGNYSNASKIIKFAGVAPYEHQSSQFKSEHMAISKKGSKYLRKTLYQIILPVIQNNDVFRAYYQLKRSQGKGHRCAQGYCIRKLLRVIYHLLSAGKQFDPLLLR